MTVLFRADASVSGGTGHVMRCLALAQILRAAGGRPEFLLAESTPRLEARLRGEGISFSNVALSPGSAEDAAETAAVAKAIGASWIVADGYSFAAPWQKQIKASRLPLLLLDDYGHAEHYFADIVLNQNLDASQATYTSRETYTRLLLGTRFVLLRDEFVQRPKADRPIPGRGLKVLVTLGGSDPDNVTGEVVEVLSRLPDIHTTIVVGGSNPHLAGLRRIVAAFPATMSIIADAYNMPELMGSADVAVAAGGTTSWELAYTGLPSLVITLASNQEAISAALDRAGLAIGLGKWNQEVKARLAGALPELLADPRRRQEMSDTGRQLVDGRGRERVLGEMKKAHPPPVQDVR